MLLSWPTDLLPSQIAQYLKSRLSHLLQEEFPELKKRYWGQHMWARGYFCGTVGEVDEGTIMRYIETQGKEEGNEDFQIAELQLLSVELSIDFSLSQEGLSPKLDFQPWGGFQSTQPIGASWWVLSQLHFLVVICLRFRRLVQSMQIECLGVSMLYFYVCIVVMLTDIFIDNFLISSLLFQERH